MGICASRFDWLLESISSSCWLWKCLSCKSCWNVWRSSSWLARGQVNITDEAKLESAVCWIYEMIVVQCAVKHGLELCLSYELWWLQTLLILTPAISVLNILLIDDNFSRIQKGLANETGEDHQTVTITIFWCRLALESALVLFFGHHWLLYIILFWFHNSVWLRNGLFLCRITDDDNSREHFNYQTPIYWDFASLVWSNVEGTLNNFAVFVNFTCTCK